MAQGRSRSWCVPETSRINLSEVSPEVASALATHGIGLSNMGGDR